MTNELIINVRPYETRVAVVENGVVVELYRQRKNGQEILGNIYRGKITRVLPGMQAAFVDIGLERSAFLYVSDVHKDIMHIEQMMFEDYTEANGSDIYDSETFQPGQIKDTMLLIEDLLHEGQQIMVQVSKEPLGEKGARLTSYISIPGRHLVLMPTVEHIGISRRIENKEKRERLKNIVQEIKPGSSGFIIRTVSEDASKEILKNEMDFLLKLWGVIQEKMEKRSSPGLLHRDLNITLRAIRDLFTNDVERLIIDSYEEYNKAMDFIAAFAPGLKHAVELYEGKEPIFEAFGIENEISRALETKIPLKSGGHIVIERTEALTAIDVNTGSYVGKTNLEETILKTNLEAVKEIARQLRFRNIGGIIVIDFISMDEMQNRESVYTLLKDALAKDKANTTVLPMSGFGLIEMTRKRTRPSLYKLLTEPCLYCDGKGNTKSKKIICDEIFRDLERDFHIFGKNGDIFVSVNPQIGKVLKEKEQEMIKYIEKRLSKRIIIITKENFHVEHYEIYA